MWAALPEAHRPVAMMAAFYDTQVLGSERVALLRLEDVSEQDAARIVVALHEGLAEHGVRVLHDRRIPVSAVITSARHAQRLR